LAVAYEQHLRQIERQSEIVISEKRCSDRDREFSSMATTDRVNAGAEFVDLGQQGPGYAFPPCERACMMLPGSAPI